MASSSRPMQYAELAPLTALESVLERIWTLEGDAASLFGEPQAVLPDGRAELILHFGDPFERVDPSGAGVAVTRQPALLFAGQLTRQLLLRPTGRISVLGLRFRPFGAATLLRPPQIELAGTTLAVADLSSDLARRLDIVRESTTDLSHAAMLAQAAILSVCERERVDRRLAYAVSRIERSHGHLPIDRLAREAGTTRRHLERLFQRGVGMSPKRLARIVRFQRAIRFLEEPGDGLRAGGAATAAACGYADQAHFIRDFRDLAGCAPSQHMISKGELTAFFTRRT